MRGPRLVCIQTNSNGAPAAKWRFRLSTEATTVFALSIKQPWAALVVAGLKTIEIRRWPTARRGRILIHAAAVPDERPEAWRHVPNDSQQLAELRGGVIGSVE